MRDAVQRKGFVLPVQIWLVAWSDRPEFTTPEVPPPVQQSPCKLWRITALEQWQHVRTAAQEEATAILKQVDLISTPCSLHPTCCLAGKACGTLCQTKTFGVQNRIYSKLLCADGYMSP